MRIGISQGVVIALVLPFAMSCGGDGGPSEPQIGPVATVQVSPADVAFDALDATRQLSAVARDASGNVVSGKTFSWSSDDPTVVTVSTSGLVTAAGNGTTQVSAMVDGVSGSASAEVVQVVSAVEISGGRDTLTAIGDTATFVAVGKDSRGNDVPGTSATWNALEDSILAITEGGLATAVRNGSGRIVATIEEIPDTSVVIVEQRGAAIAILTQPDGASAGEVFEVQPVVEIRDELGTRTENDDTTQVTASIVSGGGTLLGTTSVVVSGGVATFQDLAVGGTVGERVVGFTGPDLNGGESSGFSLTHGPASVLLIESGDGQTALADTELAAPLLVRIEDAYANVVPGAGVSWSVASGSGTLTQVDTASGAGGTASATYTLGRHAGEESVEAAASGLDGSPVAFSMTATPNGTIAGVVTVTNDLLTRTAAMIAAAPPLPERDISIRSGAPPTGAEPSLSSSNDGNPLRVRRGDALRYVPGEVLVTFSPDALPAGSDRAMDRASAQETSGSLRSVARSLADEVSGRVSGVSPAIGLVRMEVEIQVEDAIRTLRDRPGIRTVEPNYILYGFGRSPDSEVQAPDPLSPWQAWHYAMLDLPRAWEITTGSPDVLVAVIDDGIRFDHPDVGPNLTDDGYDFVSSYTYSLCSGGTIDSGGDGDGWDADPTIPTSRPYDEVFDCLGDVSASGGHGLHVSGTIGAAAQDGYGGTGVSWNARIRSVRALDISGQGTSFDIAQAILYAAGLPVDDGAGGIIQAPSAARLINMSLGGSGSTAQEDAVIAAQDAGSLIIAAAGNDATSTPSYPAGYPGVIAVSALDPSRQLASYSNFGSWIDIAAPGGDKVDGGCSFGVISSQWDFVSSTPIHSCIQGTSMASPHVTGVAALLLSSEPGLTAEQLRARLLDYAVDIGPAGEDDLYGAGIVNARNSLTQSFAPAQDLYVQLLSASSGELLESVMAAPDGSFEFRELPDADYLVFGGQDENGDQRVGLPLRRWGALGVPTAPGVHTIDGAGVYDGNFSIGYPYETEPNDSEAEFLVQGGYVVGMIEDASTDVDVYWVRLPDQASYTFETGPVSGACGFALEEDTRLELYDLDSNLLAENDDIDASALDYCSRITTALSPGDYFVVVRANDGSGRYHVSARGGGG